jgi:hypothetical protein
VESVQPREILELFCSKVVIMEKLKIQDVQYCICKRLTSSYIPRLVDQSRNFGSSFINLVLFSSINIFLKETDFQSYFHTELEYLIFIITIIFDTVPLSQTVSPTSPTDE